MNRPQRGYNSLMQVDLADMKAFEGKPYPFMLVAIDALTKKVKHKATRPEIKVGDMVRIRVKPIESRGSYRVNKIAWSEKVYRVVSAKSGETGARFGLEGWPEKVVRRDLRKVAETREQPFSGGWRCSPARGGYREAPGSHLPFDSLK